MFGGVAGRLSATFCAAALAAAAVAGCGGGDDSGSAKEPVEVAVADESADKFVERTAKTLATATTQKDCEEMVLTNARSYTRFECPTSKDTRNSMSRLEVVGVDVFGTGAVVDYKSPNVEEGAIVLFVATNRKWGIGRFGVITEPSADTDDEDSRAGFRKAVDAYLEAIRERDCAAYIEHALTEGGRKKVCDAFRPGTKELAKRLKDHPSARPKYEGGNSTYGFFTLETAKPEPVNSTISVVKGSADGKPQYVVLDVAPSPTAAQQRQVVEEYRRQQREKRNPTKPKPTKSPSGPAVKP